jgi:hypothetical protein
MYCKRCEGDNMRLTTDRELMPDKINTCMVNRKTCPDCGYSELTKESEAKIKDRKQCVKNLIRYRNGRTKPYRKKGQA